MHDLETSKHCLLSITNHGLTFNNPSRSAALAQNTRAMQSETLMVKTMLALKLGVLSRSVALSLP